MNNKNNRGFSAFEILVVLTLYATVFSIIACMGINGAKKTKFKTLKYDAMAFTYNVRTYVTEAGADIDTNNRIYLNDIVLYDDSYNIKSPFSANNCELDTSYVEIGKDQTLVTLQCDNYIIYEYNGTDDKLPIYVVSSFMDKKPRVRKNTIVDKIEVYNYKKDGKYVLDDFLTQGAFVKAYNENENTNYSSIKWITSYDLKTVYRIRKTVEK